MDESGVFNIIQYCASNWSLNVMIGPGYMTSGSKLLGTDTLKSNPYRFYNEFTNEHILVANEA